LIVLRSTFVVERAARQAAGRERDAWQMRCQVAAARVAELTDQLAQHLATALDHNRRLERVAAGLGENAPRPRPAPQPMSDDLANYIARWDNPATRDEMRGHVLGQLARGVTSQQVLADLVRQAPLPEEEVESEPL
jgi:hypothetical protein